MAFSTVLGSGGANDSFVGTTGVDAIALSNNTGNFFLGGNQANDNVQVINSGSALYTGVLTTATIRGGAGEDTLTLGNGNATVFTGAFVNGGSERDTITSNAANTFIASTVQGGKANDTITTSILTTSLVNGNKGQDTITLGAANTSATIHGGGGNDVITDGAVTTADTLISGDLGNDTVTLTNGGLTSDALTVKGGDGVDTISLGDIGVAANDDIFVSGNAGNDTLTGTSVTVTEITLAGGAGDDTIATGAGVSTTIGGLGNDAMTAGASIDVFQYTAQGQGGALGAANGTTGIAAADTIAGFSRTAEVDLIQLDASETLVGSSSTATAGAQNSWNLDNTGVFVNTNAQAFIAGTTTAATISAAIGTVTGDSGDIAYAAIDSGGTVTNLFQITLGTDKAAAALNAGDSIALIASITSDDFIGTANFSFI